MILTLPAELQIQILSHLPFIDQFTAAKVCTLWSDLLKTKSLLRTRYIEPLPEGSSKTLLGMHRLFRFYQDVPSWFGFTVQSGEVKGYFVSALTPIGVAEPIKFESIANSQFLDDPIFSPFLIKNKEQMELMTGVSKLAVLLPLKCRPNTDYRQDRRERRDRPEHELGFNGGKFEPGDGGVFDRAAVGWFDVTRIFLLFESKIFIAL
ncbi:hypothetical protein ABW20_dc0100058 [Dactylellina cionopaga]|nr:hypothetical protein ABW20_dc0100058 [Dactylellina cionopaga]